ncbi:MAG TPA: hypothetical protein VLH56_19640 [Dissulfurispiraceae bacterium]|nr:hypothetical protein [Dissulfurispiraceae bacterium]
MDIQTTLEHAARLKRLNAKVFRPLLKGGADGVGYRVSESGLTRSDVMDKVRRVYDCSGVIELRATYTPDESGVLEQKLSVHNASFCKQYLVCPICARRVQSIRRKRFEEPIRRMVETHKNAYMVTFTIKDGLSLRDRLIHLRKSVRAFMRMGQVRRRRQVDESGKVWTVYGRSGGEAGKFGAGVLGTEIKRGDDSQQWHVHAHGIFFTDEALDYRVYDKEKRAQLHAKYGNSIPKEELDKIALARVMFGGESVAVSKISSEWFAATGDSISIDVRPIKGSVRKVWDTCREILKYPVKHNPNQDHSDTIEIIEETFGKRMFSTYGLLRSIPDNDFEDPETESSSEIYSVIWEGHQYGRVRSENHAIFQVDMTEEKKKVLGIQARLQGAYRKTRAAILESVRFRFQAEGRLDEAKAVFRAGVRELWRRYKHTLAKAMEKERPELLRALQGDPKPKEYSEVVSQCVLAFGAFA